MKVRVAYTVDATDDYRRAIRLWYGEPGLATRDEVRRWLEAYGSSGDDDLMWNLTQKEPDDAPRQGQEVVEPWTTRTQT